MLSGDEASEQKYNEQLDSLVDYQRSLKQFPKHRPVNLALGRRWRDNKIYNASVRPLEPRKNEAEKKREKKVKKEKTELEVHGCCLAGLQMQRGLAEFFEELAIAKKEAKREAAVLKEERGVALSLRRLLKMPKVRIIKELPKELHRAQYPGWDPQKKGLEMREAEYEKMRDFQRRIIVGRKKTVVKNAALALRRPGPSVLTNGDVAEHAARAEGLTVEDYREKCEKQVERQFERERQSLLQERKVTEIMSRDLRPSDLEFAEKQLILERLGPNALDDSDERWFQTLRQKRRLRACLLVRFMGFLRNFKGYGVVSKEQDVVFIEPDLALGRTLDVQKERLLDLHMTHILIIGEDVPFPDDFIYCRLLFSTTERQDLLKKELDMGVTFMARAFDLGGRCVICCDDFRSSAVLILYLMRERQLCLKSAYSLIKLHEPTLHLAKSLALCLTLLEIELRHFTSVKTIPKLRNPTQDYLTRHLKLKHYTPWSLSLLMLFRGTGIGIPDPDALYHGKPPQKKKTKWLSAAASKVRSFTTIRRRRRRRQN